MGIIQHKWLCGQSRIEDGIFFGSDEFVLLEGAPDTGYSVGKRRPVADIVTSAPGDWCDLAETVAFRHKSGGLSIHAGETSWEGEGFVAVASLSGGRLVWLLHLSGSEAFVAVETDGEVIRAASGGYPLRYEWSIPITAPERFTVASCGAG
jgi:hypothetical protein